MLCYGYVTVLYGYDDIVVTGVLAMQENGEGGGIPVILASSLITCCLFFTPLCLSEQTLKSVCSFENLGNFVHPTLPFRRDTKISLFLYLVYMLGTLKDHTRTHARTHARSHARTHV